MSRAGCSSQGGECACWRTALRRECLEPFPSVTAVAVTKSETTLFSALAALPLLHNDKLRNDAISLCPFPGQVGAFAIRRCHQRRISAGNTLNFPLVYIFDNNV